jgi:hypothetical protein
MEKTLVVKRIISWSENIDIKISRGSPEASQRTERVIAVPTKITNKSTPKEIVLRVIVGSVRISSSTFFGMGVGFGAIMLVELILE